MICKICIQFYKYLFYKNYRWSLRVNTDRTGHETHATIILAGTMFFNSFTIIVTVLAVIHKIAGCQVCGFLDNPNFPLIIFSLVHGLFVLSLNFYLLKRIGYQNIIKEFSGESPRQRKLGNILVGCYEVISFLLVFASITLPS